MSHQKARNLSQATHTTEQLLEDSDDDIEVVAAKNDFGKVTLDKPSSKSLSIDTDSEIVLDDSDSDIEEVCNVPSTQKPKSTTLDEKKVKSILTKVAQNNQTLATKQSSLPPGLKLSVSNTKTPSEGPASKTQPSTPRIVLQKVGSKWQSSSTPKSSYPQLKGGPTSHQKRKGDTASEKSDSNSDEDFVPLKCKSSKSKQNDHSDVSVFDEDSNETIPKLNRSTRSTRSSVNTSRSDVSQDVTLDTSIELDDEIQEELAKLEALQEILAQTNPNEKKRSNTLPMVKKLKSKKKNQSLPRTPKQVFAGKPKETPKLKPAIVPQIIDRGPIDCFDELIVETTAGFPCNFCESKEIFKKRREMIYHMQTKHEEELNQEQRNGDLSGLFPCEICKTAFYSKFILRTHKKAHMKSSEAGCDKYYHYYLRFGRI